MATMTELHEIFELGSCWALECNSGNYTETQTMIVDAHCKHHVEFLMGLDCTEPTYRTRTLGQCGEYDIWGADHVLRRNPMGGYNRFTRIDTIDMLSRGARYRRLGGRYDNYKTVTPFYSIVPVVPAAPDFHGEFLSSQANASRF